MKCKLSSYVVKHNLTTLKYNNISQVCPYKDLGSAKNLEEELNLKRDFLRQIANIPEEDIESFRKRFVIKNKTVKFIRNV